MAIGPAHTYISQGIDKGIDRESLVKIHSASLKLKSNYQTYIHSLGHLAHCSQVNYHYLRKVVKRAVTPYEFYSIPKRSGGHRYISSPKEPVKQAQRWINKFILSAKKPHWRCFSYRSDVSIIHAANEHCNSKWLIKIDIENFFDSVNEVKVYKIYRELGYNPLLSFELTRLSTICPTHLSKQHFRQGLLYNKNSEDLPYEKKGIKFLGRLPQGAPTSPSLSNLVFEPIDIQLQEYANDKGLVYTRYADDICFSTNLKEFGRDDAVRAIKYCSRLFRKHGYATKKVKTKIIPPGVPKIVLGLNVNHDVPKLSKAYKKRVESHVRGIEKFGVKDHAGHKDFNSIYGMLEHVTGLINHAMLVDKTYAQKLTLRFKAAKLREGLS